MATATGEPAYSPWMENNDPTSGKGFGAAVVYAVTGKLGFTDTDVVWARSIFDAAVAPGVKDWGFNLQQFSIAGERRDAVDFSSSYYITAQTVVILRGPPASRVTTVAEFKGALLGAQTGTTSHRTFTETVAPAITPSVFNNSQGTVQTLKGGQMDAIVVDLPTTLYLAASELDGGVVVGRFADIPGGDQFGLVLLKGSALIAVVTGAIDALRADGTLDPLTKTWLPETANVPVLSRSMNEMVDNFEVVSSTELGRRRYCRRQTIRSVLISVISTIVFAVVIWLVLENSPGWQVTRGTFFSARYFATTLPEVAVGLWLNTQILFFAVIGVAILAVILAVLRSSRGPVFFPLRSFAAAYTDLFRGMPPLVVLYLIGFGIPALNLTACIPAALLGTAAPVLTYSPYVAGALRVGLEAVHPSQRLAVRSLGLSHGQTLRYVVTPQAIRKVTPALMNDFISMQKDVGLILVLGTADVTRTVQIQQTTTYNFTPYVVAGLLFVAFSWPSIRPSDWYTTRLREREQTGGTV